MVSENVVNVDRSLQVQKVIAPMKNKENQEKQRMKKIMKMTQIWQKRKQKEEQEEGHVICKIVRSRKEMSYAYGGNKTRQEMVTITLQ